MRETFAQLVSGCLVFATGSATLAAPDQARPGEPTPARVWIQNQGNEEAVPVHITEPPTVTVTGTPAVALVQSSAVVQTRGVKQGWEYRAVTVPSNQEAAAVLSTAGQDGWETAGLQFPTQGGVVVLMKRPRS
jgi:hypothetical protein